MRYRGLLRLGPWCVVLAGAGTAMAVAAGGPGRDAPVAGRW
jgi:hypothetical protein